MSLKDYWDRSGPEPVWAQPYDELLADALYEWKGSNSSLGIWMNKVLDGTAYSVDTNGTAKIWRAQAEVIIDEVRNGPQAPRLYRGDTQEPVGIRGWSANLATAKRFAKLGGGDVWVLEQGRGLEIERYAPGSGLNHTEQEWIVDVRPGQAQILKPRGVTAGKYYRELDEPDEDDEDGWEAWGSKTSGWTAYPGNETMKLYRGLNFGEDFKTYVLGDGEYDRANQSALLREVFRGRNNSGWHWSTDMDVAYNFALDNDLDGWANSDPGYEKVIWGVVVEAEVPRSSILRHPDDDPDDFYGGDVFEYDHPEREVPLKDGAPFHVTYAAIVARDEDGHHYEYVVDSGLVPHTASALDDAINGLVDTLLAPHPSVPNADGSYGYMGNWEYPDYSDYDWDKRLRGVSKIYRGYGLDLPSDRYDWIFHTYRDEQHKRDVAEWIVNELSTYMWNTGLGAHWTSFRGEAAGFAGMASDKGGLRVILHARTPSTRDIMSADEQDGQGIFHPDDNEQEIPLRKGAPVEITAVEWAPGGPKPMLRSDDGGGWIKHDVSMTKTAGYNDNDLLGIGTEASTTQGLPEIADPPAISLNAPLDVRCTDAVFEAIAGYPPPRMLRDGQSVLQALQDEGYSYSTDGYIPAKTVKGLMQIPGIDQGVYYFFSSGHAMCLVNGVLTDTEGKGPDMRRIIGFYEITPTSDRGLLRGAEASMTKMAGGEFDVKMMPATLSGYKAHIYCEDVDDVEMAWNRIKLEAEIFGWGVKLARKAFFEYTRNTPQFGKGVTIYFPERENAMDDIAYLVRLMQGWPERLQKPIANDEHYVGNGVSWRFEFSPDPGYNIDPSDVMRWYKAASVASKMTPDQRYEVRRYGDSEWVLWDRHDIINNVEGGMLYDIGYLKLGPGNVIQEIHIDGGYRRDGLATFLFNVVQDEVGTLKHSDPIDMTPAGLEWSKSVDRVPVPGEESGSFWNPLMAARSTSALDDRIYRGLSVEIGEEFIDAINAGQVDQYITALVAGLGGDRSQWSMSFGNDSDGLGVHWSRSEQIARSFSDKVGAVHLEFYGWLSVVVEASYTPGDEMDIADVHAYGWNGKDEQEVPLKPGSPVTVHSISYFGPRDLQGFADQFNETGEAHATDRIWRKIPLSTRSTAALDNEARISVAEYTMERLGLAGDTIAVPEGHRDDPAYQAAIEPLRQWVSDLCRKQMRFYASDYVLDTYNGGAQAATDGYNWICVRPITNTMTILHEVAHVLNASSEGEGHDDQFIHTLSELYRKHLGSLAAEQFLKIAIP